MTRGKRHPEVAQTPLRKFRVMWSLRGRAIVEAYDELGAKQEFYQLVEKGQLHPEDGDCDGYEVDEVREA